MCGTGEGVGPQTRTAKEIVRLDTSGEAVEEASSDTTVAEASNGPLQGPSCSTVLQSRPPLSARTPTGANLDIGLHGREAHEQSVTAGPKPVSVRSKDTAHSSGPRARGQSRSRAAVLSPRGRTQSQSRSAAADVVLETHNGRWVDVTERPASSKDPAEVARYAAVCATGEQTSKPDAHSERPKEAFPPSDSANRRLGQRREQGTPSGSDGDKACAEGLCRSSISVSSTVTSSSVQDVTPMCGLHVVARSTPHSLSARGPPHAPCQPSAGAPGAPLKSAVALDGSHPPASSPHLSRGSHVPDLQEALLDRCPSASQGRNKTVQTVNNEATHRMSPLGREGTSLLPGEVRILQQSLRREASTVQGGTDKGATDAGRNPASEAAAAGSVLMIKDDQGSPLKPRGHSGNSGSCPRSSPGQALAGDDPTITCLLPGSALPFSTKTLQEAWSGEGRGRGDGSHPCASVGQQGGTDAFHVRVVHRCDAVDGGQVGADGAVGVEGVPKSVGVEERPIRQESAELLPHEKSSPGVAKDGHFAPGALPAYALDTNANLRQEGGVVAPPYEMPTASQVKVCGCVGTSHSRQPSCKVPTHPTALHTTLHLIS